MGYGIKIELVPDLEHCIETVATKKYAEITRGLLKSKTPDPEMEEKLEILRLFLVNSDFGKLRSESEKHLTEGKNVRFFIYLDKGVPRYEMQVI
ncbi:MAG: hypothetical protein JW967_03200 [Dehalococcoidales bacterium]|nr:hypothetical protein [Dehalococcoidales bacterium]